MAVLGFECFSISVVSALSLNRYHRFALEHGIDSQILDVKEMVQHCQKNITPKRIQTQLGEKLTIIPFHFPGFWFASMTVKTTEFVVSGSSDISALQTIIYSLFESIKADHQHIRLSKREQECVEWLSEGKTTPEIAVILNISERTASFHVNNIIHKTQSLNRHQALTKVIMSS
ncbi:hypothetical protein CS022_09555 [Veronia nyctiphanis]|uniref:HTH luxR-type domain-containing protein n=2 Tax=Veronia nyctiphanis TaxID=1278244 RepID=A0A4Q0YWV2_9GAMM|nr:hypothetical protein CS022_09555 [Veronia nyctiphanis]